MLNRRPGDPRRPHLYDGIFVLLEIASDYIHSTPSLQNTTGRSNHAKGIYIQRSNVVQEIKWLQS